MNERDKELAVQSELMRKYNYAYSKELQEFAELIRADERERIKAANAPEIERINTYIKKLEDAVKDERGALIRYFNGHWRSDWSDGQNIAEYIRARGNK